MDLLNRLSAKQLIVIVLVIGFLIYNLDSTTFIKEFFESVADRFNIKKKLNEVDVNSNKVNTNSNKNNGSQIKNINQLREKYHKEPSKNNEDEFCNSKRGRKNTQFEEMFQCLLNNTPTTKDILMPNNVIPYNFDNKKDNNVLYSISPDYTQNKLSYEKTLSGGVSAVNNKILHSNFDKDIDYYKISRRRDTILNSNKDSVICNINNLVKFPKEIKILTRVIDDKVSINWNIPILPFGYIPKEIILVLSRHHDLTKSAKSSEFYTIPFVKKPCEFEGDGFKIRTNILGNRIFHNLTSEKKEWYNNSKRCYKLSSRVYFLFNYYDSKKVLRECVIESNVSNLF